MGIIPPGIDFIKFLNDLLAIPAVAEVNDLHIWQTGADQKLLSARRAAKPDTRIDCLMQARRAAAINKIALT